MSRSHIVRILCVAAPLVVASTPAYADKTVEFCVDIQTNFTDNAGADFWTTNADRNARGVLLEVRLVSNGALQEGDYLSDTTGCITWTIPSGSYNVTAISEAEVNGVPIEVWSSDTGGSQYGWPLLTTWSPDTSDGSELLDIPASTESGMLAVATWLMHNNNMGLSGSTPLKYANDDCCSAGAGDWIYASNTSQTIIAHETGHEIGYRREGDHTPIWDYNAAENNCDGKGVDQDKHADSTKEFQSGAALEGFGDTISAWAWNDTSQGDCTFNRHYVSDWNLDGDTTDGESDQVNCEGEPYSGAPGYVAGRDWLEGVVNGADSLGCTGTLTNRSSQYDWLRYGWDMLQDESVPIDDYVDLYDDANPQSWDPNSGTGTTADDPIVRWEASADGHSPSYQTAHDNQKNNGLDH